MKKPHFYYNLATALTPPVRCLRWGVYPPPAQPSMTLAEMQAYHDGYRAQLAVADTNLVIGSDLDTGFNALGLSTQYYSFANGKVPGPLSNPLRLVGLAPSGWIYDGDGNCSPTGASLQYLGAVPLYWALSTNISDIFTASRASQMAKSYGGLDVGSPLLADGSQALYVWDSTGNPFTSVDYVGSSSGLTVDTDSTTFPGYTVTRIRATTPGPRHLRLWGVDSFSEVLFSFNSTVVPFSTQGDQNAGVLNQLITELRQKGHIS